VSEATRTRTFLQQVRQARPTAFAYKVNDRVRAGIPDSIIVDDGQVTWVEFKRLRPGQAPINALSEIQKLTIRELIVAGADVVVVVFRGAVQELYAPFKQGRTIELVRQVPCELWGQAFV
jgi:type IV secretory pathway VirB9-like protein